LVGFLFSFALDKAIGKMLDMRVNIKNGFAARNATACRPTVTGIVAGIVGNVAIHFDLGENIQKQINGG
jgi:hypothetical protein